MNSIKETLSALEDRKDRTDIKSPVDGTVKDLKINTVGGVVKPGDAMMEIVPVNDQLVIEAQIRPKDIAFLHPGQKAVIKITAYDYGIYGGLNGEVVDISADTIANEKGELFYHVKIRTFDTALKRKGEVLPIIPGMVATAEILTGHKTVMEYILKPFIKTVDTALRER
jgi:membrane fusion protein, adhesin transport system